MYIDVETRAPTSGGQYHWVSEFAPRKHQKLLSYIAGWMAVLSWQAATASGGFVTGTLVQSVLGVNFPDDPTTDWETRWQGTLLAIGCVIIVALMNNFGNRLLPTLQSVLMILHIVAWIVTIVLFSARSPHPSASQVFGSESFQNTGGWSSMGLALMIGQISSIFALVS